MKSLIIKWQTQNFRINKNLEYDENHFLITFPPSFSLCFSISVSPSFPLYSRTHTTGRDGMGRMVVEETERQLFNNQKNTFQSTDVLLTILCYLLWV